MKEYAELLYPEDKEKQAEYLKEYADKLIEEGEKAEGIILYRMIAREFPETEKSFESLYKVAEIIEKEESECEGVKQTIKEYENLIKKYPKNKFGEEIYFKIAKIYKDLGKTDISIKYLEEYLKNYPESKKRESALFYLGLLYKESKNLEKTKMVWEEYLNNYPEGIYSSIIKTFLRGGE